jgi:WD40 repeat protein/RNase P subunit RPR2
MTDSPSFRFDVFLSYNPRDKPRVRRLAERLKAAGARVWLDDWVRQTRKVTVKQRKEGLEQSRVLLLCISQAALDSGWVALERGTAIHRDPANAGRRFMPLLVGDCDVPDTLRGYRYVDFRDESEAAFAEVLAACRSETESVLAAPHTGVPKMPRTEKLQPAKRAKDTEPLAVLEREIEAHLGWIYNVAVSPDGKWAASGSRDKTVKIWDLETGSCRATLPHKSEVAALAITRDGQQILSSAQDQLGILRWDPKTCAVSKAWKIHHWWASSIVPLQDGNTVFSSGVGKEDPFARLFEMDSGKCLKTYEGHSDVVTCLAINRLGTSAVSGSHDNTLRHWSIGTGECLAVLEGHSDIVQSVQMIADGRFAISGSSDQTVKVWDLKTETCVGTLEGHEGTVHSVAISPDETLIASTGFIDETVRIWDWKSGTCLQVIKHTVPGHNVATLCVTFSPEGGRLLVGTAQGTIYVYRLTDVHPKPPTDETRRYVNAKVVLLGEGTVGKTSLAHRLIEDRYVVQDRTHGMNVWRLDLPLPPDASLEREALLWDLAGQEDYRLIHQLFLEQTALALLLINPQKEDPFVEAGDWLKALKTAANEPQANRDAARLLIFSQVDVGGLKIGNAKIDRFRERHGFANWLPTSAKSGENCSDEKNFGQPSKLKQLIAGSIPWDKLAWTSTPRLLAELKNAVIAIRNESDTRLLRFSELAQRLEQALPGEKFGESDLRTAVTLLANHGLARPLKFGDLVLLRPDLINGYAGAVIRAARTHMDEIGSVLEADIYGSDFDFTGVTRLKHRPDEELLLRALVQTFLDHSLCIAEETPYGRHLVFPSQYRREKDTPKNPDIFVSYTFSGEWQTVWTTLVVRLWYSQEFAHRELWRNAGEFASAKGHTLGLLIKKESDGAATISLYFDAEVPDELKVLFIEYVHRHLARYACDVVRDRRYLCPECKKPVTDLDAVRERLAAKKYFITCQGCDEKVPLIDFIEQRLKSDPVARKILAMEEKTTRELDTQALEQILIGHMMAIAGEANQIFRPAPLFDYGIDGEVEFKDNDGKASGKRIYIQLKSGNSYLRTRKGDGSEIFDVKDDRHLKYWTSQPVDVYLVIRQTDELRRQEVIRWMNVTRYLKSRKDKRSHQITFDGEKLDMKAVWKVRDEFFSPAQK